MNKSGGSADGRQALAGRGGTGTTTACRCGRWSGPVETAAHGKKDFGLSLQISGGHKGSDLI